MPTNRPEFEINENGHHRLVSKDKTTDWASYQAFTYLNGYVGCTDYWIKDGGVFTAHEFLTATAISPEV